MTAPFVRYFAQTDDSPTGNLAFAYMIAMVRMEVPIRLVSVCGAQVMSDEDGVDIDRWSRFRNELVTPVPKDFINVVCTEPAHWRRLLTRGFQNVLVVTGDPPDEREAMAAFDYESILCAKQSDVVKWTSHPLGIGKERKVQWILAQAFHDAYAS